MINKECPFCHKTLLRVETKESRNFTYIAGVKVKALTASVRCNCCHSRGPTVTVKYTSSQTDKFKALEVAGEKAYEAWNNR